MTRNSILVAILVVVLGLGGGLWLALTPDDGGVAAPQPTPAARPAGGGTPEQTPEQVGEQAPEQTGEQAEQQAGQAEPASPQPVQSQPEAADAGQPEEELAETEAPANQEPAEAVETPADDEEVVALADATEDAAAETEVSEEAVATEETATEETATEETATEDTAAEEMQASLPTPAPPSFDIVRVEKDGSTVVAGRAPPGSTVTLYDGDTPLASAEADASGSFVLILEAPLPPGSRVLTLSAEQDGTTVASLGEVVVVVPEPAQAGAVQTAASGEEASDAPAPDTAPDTPIVIATDGQGASVVLQAPGDLGGDTLRIEAVDYDLEGQVVISGRGPAGGTVALYLDQVPLGQARIDAEGRWRFTPEGAVAPGLHRLRADLLTADGQVAQRAEIPFSRAEPIQTAANEDFVVVQPGNSLWVIARGKYGQGIRYTAIYEANADQIRDPDLIYPGQIFLIPAVN